MSAKAVSVVAKLFGSLLMLAATPWFFYALQVGRGVSAAVAFVVGFVGLVAFVMGRFND